MVFLGVMLLSFMATHTPLVEKVAVIRHQLGLAEGLNVADTVAEAVKQLGLVGEVAGRDLIQRADACLVMLRLPAETMPTPEQAAEVRSALDCKRLGYSVSQCKDRGFTAVQCKEAGYSAAELNDKGRLWQEEFERMVQEAKKFSDEDKKVREIKREKIKARNALENYVYSMKNTLNDSENRPRPCRTRSCPRSDDKISDDDKEAIEKALEEANEWLDDNQEAEKEDFDEKLKEVQDACSPIISKVYRESGGAPGGGDFGGDDDLDGHDEL